MVAKDITKTNGNLKNKRLIKELVEEVCLRDKVIYDIEADVFQYLYSGELIVGTVGIYYDVECLPDDNCFILTMDILTDKKNRGWIMVDDVSDITDEIAERLDEKIKTVFNNAVVVNFAGAEPYSTNEYFGVTLKYDMEVTF